MNLGHILDKDGLSLGLACSWVREPESLAQLRFLKTPNHCLKIVLSELAAFQRLCCLRRTLRCSQTWLENLLFTWQFSWEIICRFRMSGISNKPREKLLAMGFVARFPFPSLGCTTCFPYNLSIIFPYLLSMVLPILNNYCFSRSCFFNIPLCVSSEAHQFL